MNGVIKTYDPKQFVGTVEDDGGKVHLVKRNSMRRGTILRERVLVIPQARQ